MLYNIEKKKVRTSADCMVCKSFNRREKKCEGINKVCFLYDPKTKTCIDGVTKLPINITNKGEKK